MPSAPVTSAWKVQLGREVYGVGPGAKHIGVLMAEYNQRVARMMIYGDGWENPSAGVIYGEGPGQTALRKLGDIVPDDNPIAVIDAWSEVDDQIAQLG